MKSNRLIEEIVSEISMVIRKGTISKTKRICPQDGKVFSITGPGSMKYFCSPRCYGKFHRIPGQIRRLRKEEWP